MTTELFIIELFDRVDDHMKEVKKHSQSSLYPSEIVTLALLFSIKGVGGRAFYRWLKRDWLDLFPQLPSRTRLLRLFKTHRHWADLFLEEPTIMGVVDTYGVELIHPIREGRSDKQIGKKGLSNHRWIVGSKLCLLLNQFGLVVDWDCDTANLEEPTIMGVVDTYGVELIHPIREGRSDKQIGKKGLSNHRWIVGSKLCLLLNQFGLVVDWDCDTANVPDNTFHYLIEPFIEKMIVFADSGFHSKDGDPENLKICQKGEWNDRMLVETVLSMLTVVSHFKKMTHRKWDYLKSRIAYYMASFNILTQWFGLPADEDGFVPLSIKDFSL